MNSLEKWAIAKGVDRYLKEIREQNVFKNRILPLIQDFAGDKTPDILNDIRALLEDWINELDEFLKKSA